MIFVILNILISLILSLFFIKYIYLLFILIIIFLINDIKLGKLFNNKLNICNPFICSILLKKKLNYLKIYQY